MNERGITVPVVLGGAALTRRYVENDLQSIYKGVVSYAGDAFDGLHFIEQLKSRGVESFLRAAVPPTAADEDGEELLTGAEAKMAMAFHQDALEHRSAVTADVSIPVPPFWGTRVV